MSSFGRFQEYPLHILVWKNAYKELDNELKGNKHDIEKLDPRGRTPLMLAVTLGHLESCKILLQHNANVNIENKEGFSVVHEAISTGDPELVKLVLERRDYQRYSSRAGGIPDLLQKIKDTPDFYVEMKWEFTSWVPLVSRMCPSDTYKVYKSGSDVRIDTTLLGFDQKNWHRGSRSYIFKGQDNGGAVMFEVDHDAHKYYQEELEVLSPEIAELTAANFTDLNSKAIAARLTSPIVATYVDTDKISFERNKSGMWGWRNDKMETINGYECKVFSANNVELVTKTRLEHLSEADKAHFKNNSSMRGPLQNLLGGIVETHESASNNILSNGELCSGGQDEMKKSGGSCKALTNPHGITLEEYLDPNSDLVGRDIGRPRDQATRTQRFRATLWLCETFPLSLPAQVLPIIDLMAINSTHFAKLRDFITLQLPSGFPVKIEIPLFHVINARITFGNIFGTEESLPGVTCITDNDKTSCVLDDSLFEPPSHYSRIGAEEPHHHYVDEDDELLQYAIQQSLVEAGSEEDQVTIWEALTGQKPAEGQFEDAPSSDEEAAALQRAIQESMLNIPTLPPAETNEIDPATAPDENLELALRLSLQAKEEEDRQRQEEEELIQRVLQLSQTEK